MKSSKRKSLAALFLVLPFGLIGNAEAHILLENKKAEGGAYYKAVFQVGHGCHGSATKQLIVTIPAGVVAVKPMVKAGWKIETDKGPLAQSYTMHGRAVTETVTQVRWSGGPLADGEFDEFILVAKLPEKPGPLFWRVSQVCEQGRMDWVEVPAEGKKSSDYEMPAPGMEILPKK